MKRFLRDITIFLVPLVLFFYLLEKRLQLIPNSYNQKKYYIEQKLDSIEVLNLGSSHALYSFNPAYYSVLGFNLGNVTQTLYYDRKLLAYYIDSLPNLKMVIVPVSYFSLHRHMRHMREDWRMFFYYYYWGFPVRERSILNVNRYSLLAIYTPRTVMGMIRRGFKMNLAKGYTPYGFQAHDSVSKEMNVDEKAAIGREEYLSQGFTPENVAEGTKELDELLQLITAHQVIPVLITTPAYKAFTAHAKPEILARLNEVIDSMCRKYNCRYFNYFTDTRFVKEDFADNDHTNARGAAKFSKIVDSEIIRPMLKK